MPEAAPVIVWSPSGRESVPVKARRLLAEGRVTVISRIPGRIFANVKGTEQTYAVRWEPRHGWSCSCPAGARACSHRVAVALVVVPEHGERR